MKALMWCTNILNLIVVLSLIVYFPIVYLNYTFTHSNLPDDNVPFYISDDPVDDTEKSSGQFELFWWIYATDALRLLFPLLAVVNIIILRYNGTGFTIFVQFTFIALLLWEFVKFIWSVVFWIPDNCKNHQFCRSLEARRDAIGTEIGEDPGTANFVYSFMTWYNLDFFFIAIIYLIIVGSMEGSLFSWRSIGQNGPPEKPEDPKPSIAWTSIALMSIFVLLLIFYIPLVFLNFTFTDPKITSAVVVAPISRVNLPDDRIPYYINDDLLDPIEGDSQRYGLYWWVFASNMLLLFVPIAVLGTIAVATYDGGALTLLTQIFLFILLVWQVVKYVWIAILALPSLCDDFQFCRPFCARRDLGGPETGCNPRNLNFVYSSLVWFDLAFVILLIVTLIIVSMMEGAAFKGAFNNAYSSSQSSVNSRARSREKRTLLKVK